MSPVIIAKEDQGMAVLFVYITAKVVLATFIPSKTEQISFKSGCIVLVVKHIRIKETVSWCCVNNHGLKQLFTTATKFNC